MCVYECVKRYCLLYSLNTCRRGRNVLMHAVLQYAALYSAPTVPSNVGTWPQNSNRSVIWRFNKMICDTTELKVVTYDCLDMNILNTTTYTLITVQRLIRSSIIQHYPACPLHMMEILLNPACMGSPRPCAGAKAPSETLIVLSQSCKRICGSQNGLERKQLVSCSL